MIKWLKAASIRAAKTAAQAALGGIGSAVLFSGVDWYMVASATGIAAIISILMSITGIPEVDNGNSLVEIYRGNHARD